MPSNVEMSVDHRNACPKSRQHARCVHRGGEILQCEPMEAELSKSYCSFLLLLLFWELAEPSEAPRHSSVYLIPSPSHPKYDSSTI